MAKLSRAVLLVASVAALAACGKKPPPQLPPDPISTPTPSVPGGNTVAVPGSQAHFVANVRSDRILFDTDRFNVDSEDQVTLQSQAQWLQAYPNANVVIEGHADERGTREYNLALGERRANAAKNYLVSLGVPAARIRVISYGKERPDALGSDESSWARNRRAVTVVIQ